MRPSPGRPRGPLREEPRSTSPVDGYSPYDPQTTCTSGVQPGLQALRELIAAEYPDHASFLTLRDCADGGVSEHKEGRALDWMLDVDDPGDNQIAWDFVN